MKKSALFVLGMAAALGIHFPGFDDSKTNTRSKEEVASRRSKQAEKLARRAARAKGNKR